MKLKRILRGRERTTLAVDRVVHVLVKAYARKKNISVAQATWQLLGKSLAEDAGVEIKNEEKED